MTGTTLEIGKARATLELLATRDLQKKSNKRTNELNARDDASHDASHLIDLMSFNGLDGRDYAIKHTGCNTPALRTAFLF